MYLSLVADEDLERFLDRVDAYEWVTVDVEQLDGERLEFRCPLCPEPLYVDAGFRIGAAQPCSDAWWVTGTDTSGAQVIECWVPTVKEIAGLPVLRVGRTRVLELDAGTTRTLGPAFPAPSGSDLVAWSEEDEGFLVFVDASKASNQIASSGPYHVEDLVGDAHARGLGPRCAYPGGGALDWDPVHTQRLESGGWGFVLRKSPGLGTEWCGNCSTSDLLVYLDRDGNGALDELWYAAADGLSLLRTLSTPELMPEFLDWIRL